IRPEAAEGEGAQGFRVTGSQFQRESTCDAGFVKDAALCLEEVFGAYRQYFDIRRNADRKVKALVFADRAEYARSAKRRHGGATPGRGPAGEAAAGGLEEGRDGGSKGAPGGAAEGERGDREQPEDHRPQREDPGLAEPDDVRDDLPRGVPRVRVELPMGGL